jgi:hypothetical protein
MRIHRKFNLHGDNVVECERILHLVELALSDSLVSLSGPFGPPANPSFQLRLAGGREVLHFTFYPGFGRWNDDVLRLIQGGNRNLREAPDVLMCEVKSGREVAILAIEFSGALSAGNQAWQRSGRAYSSGFSTVPYLYLLEVGGHELDAGRGKKATRLPNPAVPFSYLTFSSASTFPILPVLVPSPGCDPKTRDEFSDAFGFTDLLELLRAVILSTDISGAVKALEGRVLEFVVKISAGSRAGRTLSTVQWREAHQALSEGEEGLVGYLLGQQKIRWSKRRSGKVEITDRVKQLMSLAARYGQGLSSSYLPFCLVAASDRLTLARSILSLYPRLGDDYLEWLRRERPLVVCWITGYKHRGDDSRPDRGLVPFARMLVGEDCDLLSVVYGPGPDQHWRVLEDKPLELAHNGLWEAIMATSDAILVDPVNGGIARHGYLRRHWDTVEDPPEVRSMFVWPLPTSFGEQDVDTVIHLLFARLSGPSVFEGLCNPPGGDWSGLSLQTVDRSKELRWLTLPRVTGPDSKRPDHVLQLFGVAGETPLVLIIESKRDASLLRSEGAVGPRLVKYVSDLVGLPASVERGLDKDRSWTETNTKFGRRDFSYVAAVAFLIQNEGELATIGRRTHSDLQIGLVFDQTSGECAVHLLPMTDAARRIAEFVDGLDLKDVGLSVRVHQ